MRFSRYSIHVRFLAALLTVFMVPGTKPPELFQSFDQMVPGTFLLRPEPDKTGLEEELNPVRPEPATGPSAGRPVEGQSARSGMEEPEKELDEIGENALEYVIEAWKRKRAMAQRKWLQRHGRSRWSMFSYMPVPEVPVRKPAPVPIRTEKSIPAIQAQSAKALPRGLDLSQWLFWVQVTLDDLVKDGISRFSILGGEVVLILRTNRQGIRYQMLDLFTRPSAGAWAYLGRLDLEIEEARSNLIAENAGSALSFSAAAKKVLEQEIGIERNKIQEARLPMVRKSALYTHRPSLERLDIPVEQVELALAYAAVELGLSQKLNWLIVRSNKDNAGLSDLLLSSRDAGEVLGVTMGKLEPFKNSLTTQMGQSSGVEERLQELPREFKVVRGLREGLGLKKMRLSELGISDKDLQFSLDVADLEALRNGEETAVLINHLPSGRQWFHPRMSDVRYHYGLVPDGEGRETLWLGQAGLTGRLNGTTLFRIPTYTSAKDQWVPAVYNEPLPMEPLTLSVPDAGMEEPAAPAGLTERRRELWDFLTKPFGTPVTLTDVDERGSTTTYVLPALRLDPTAVERHDAILVRNPRTIYSRWRFLTEARGELVTLTELDPETKKESSYELKALGLDPAVVRKQVQLLTRTHPISMDASWRLLTGPVGSEIEFTQDHVAYRLTAKGLLPEAVEKQAQLLGKSPLLLDQAYNYLARNWPRWAEILRETPSYLSLSLWDRLALRAGYLEVMRQRWSRIHGTDPLPRPIDLNWVHTPLVISDRAFVELLTRSGVQSDDWEQFREAWPLWVAIQQRAQREGGWDRNWLELLREDPWVSQQAKTLLAQPERVSVFLKDDGRLRDPSYETFWPLPEREPAHQVLDRLAAEIHRQFTYATQEGHLQHSDPLERMYRQETRDSETVIRLGLSSYYLEVNLRVVEGVLVVALRYHLADARAESNVALAYEAGTERFLEVLEKERLVLGGQWIHFWPDSDTRFFLWVPSAVDHTTHWLTRSLAHFSLEISPLLRGKHKDELTAQVIGPSVWNRYPLLEVLGELMPSTILIDPGGEQTYFVAQRIFDTEIQKVRYYGLDHEHRTFTNFLNARVKIPVTRAEPGGLPFTRFLHWLLASLVDQQPGDIDKKVNLREVEQELKILSEV